MTIEGFLRQCNKSKLNLVSLTIKKPPYADLQAKIIDEMPWLIDLILRHNNGLSYEELTSGLITLVLEKNG